MKYSPLWKRSLLPLPLICAVAPLILPGCSGGGGSSFRPTPTATPVPTVGTANISFVARNGAYFGDSPYTVTDVTATEQENGNLIIGFAPVITGSDARYFTLTIQPSGPIQNGQTFSLQSGGSTLIASAPEREGSPNYVGYGGTQFTTGSVRVTRTGNVATFVLNDVVVRDVNTETPTNKRLTFNATITVLLPNAD